jgi:hypothetical protein
MGGGLYESDMNEFDYWKIVKWVIIVLLAGFIGQFGKSLAKYFMTKGKDLKKGNPPENIEQTVLQTNSDSRADNLPAGKESKSYADSDKNVAKEKAKEEKKSLKALAKQKKKAAKQLEKAGE